MSKWKYNKLSKLCSRIGDGIHGTPEYSDDSDIFFINGNNLKNGRIEINKNTNRVSIEELENNFIPLNGNSLLLSINGTLGSLSFYNNEKVMLGKSAAYLNFKSEINKFYYYYFQLSHIQQYFLNVATGSTIKNLSLKSIQDFEVPVPEPNEWKNISNVLSSLDSKIELNNRINTELEAMAKTLYDYWFVQFDFPDINGKPYKTSGGKMVWNEELKREIPEGWNVNILGKYITIERGISYKGTEIGETGIPMVNLNSFHLDGRFKYDGIKFFSGSVNENKVIKSGDLMIATTDVTRNAYIIGKSFLLPDLYKGIVVASCDIAKVNISNELDKYYLDMMFNSDNYHKYIKGFASGTIVLHLDTKGIEWYNCIIPPKDLLNKYAALKKEIDGKKTLTLKENQQLSSLRDWLLPMLMNGQVTVGGSVEKKIEYEMEEEMRMVAEPER